MNLFNPRETLLTVCAITAAIASASATTIKSTYIGPEEGNWGDPANWSPAIVPNNGGGNTFAVSIAKVFLTLDLDVAVNRITFTAGDPLDFGGDAPFLYCLDHNFSSLHTKVGAGGQVAAAAVAKDVTVDLGELADFSGTTLNTGYTYLVTAEPGRAATLRFNNAHIVSSAAGIELVGTNTRLVDENGTNALAHFRHNLFDGYFDLEVGRNFTTEGSFVNEGLINVYASDPGFVTGDTNTTLTISGNYTDIGYPLDPNTDGEVVLLAPGPNGNARMVIKGALTNYDADTQTLHKSYFGWEAANGASATTRVLGGGKPLDIVISKAALNLFGPNTGFRDEFGNDALRNLAVSARLLIGDRNFTTANSFVTTSRLSIFGDTLFTVNGNLTVQSGFFEVSPLTGYARNGDPGFPTDAYLTSKVLIHGNLNLPSQSALRFHIYNDGTTATINVDDTAIFAGLLQAGVEDVSKITFRDKFIALAAGKIAGQFSNVPSGGRVSVYSAFDSLGNPVGDPIGSFRVTYDKDGLLILDQFKRTSAK